MDRRLPAVPAVRVGSSLHLASYFCGRRRGSARSTPPALMADVRFVIRRHFPVGPKGPIVERVADDIALRRRPSRKLRNPNLVQRALAEHVLPFVEHPIDRRAVANSSKEICAYVSGACADPRLADGGVQVLVLLDTFACPTLLLPAASKQSTRHSLDFGMSKERTSESLGFGVFAVGTGPCMEIAQGSKDSRASAADGGVRTCPCMEIGMRSDDQKSVRVGTIGDGRPVKDGGVDRQQGWLPW